MQSLTQRIQYYQIRGYEVEIYLNGKICKASELSLDQLASTDYEEKLRPTNRLGKIIKTFRLKETV